MLKILTLNWNGASKLEKLYPSVMNSLDRVDYQWIIKDNGSADSSIDLIKSWNNNRISLLECGHNRDNFSKGCNVAFKESQSKNDDFILLLNNDVIFKDTSSIKNMIQIMDRDKSVGVVGAKLTYTDTDIIQHAGVVFHPHAKMPLHFRANHKEDTHSKMNREFQAVTGAVWLTKSQYYNKICTENESGIDGLNEKLIWMFDDIDASLSIKYNLNKKIVYCGSTNIFHEESASLKKNPVNKLFMNHNQSFFINKWADKIKLDMEVYSKNNKHNLYK